MQEEKNEFDFSDIVDSSVEGDVSESEFDFSDIVEEETDVKKKEQTKPVQETPLPGLGGVSEEPTPSPSVGQGVLRDVDQTQPTGEGFIAGVSDLTRTDVREPDVRVTGAGGAFVTKEDAAPIVAYEENQKALSEIDKQISGADISKLPIKERMLFGDFESKVSGDLDELKKQRDILAKRSDQLISDTEKDVSRIISSGIGDNWEDFTNELGDIDVSKIGDFARQEALNYGLPEDGYFFERVKNAAKAKVEMEKISPTVDAFLLGGERRSPEGIVRKKDVQLPGYDSPSTVLMSSYGSHKVDGKYVAFPTLFPKDPKRQTSDPKDWIVAKNDDEAYRIAKERGEVLYFDTREEADSMAEGSWKKTKGTYEELYGVKPEDDAEAMLSREDLRKSLGLSKLDAEFSEQMAQLNRDISRSSTQEIERISQDRYGMPIDEYVSQLGQGYERSVNEVESRYSSLIQDGKFVGSQDQYNAYQQELQSVRSGYESQFNDVVSQNMRDVAAVNNRANRRFNRQRDEILEAYRTEYQDKAKAINPTLQERYQKAYNKALDKAMEVENIKKESRAMLRGKLATGSFMGGIGASGFISGASGQMSSIFRAMGMKEGAEFWEQAAINFDIGDTEIKGWKDILDPKKLVKSTSFTIGGMTPMLAASTGVGLVTGGAGAPATLTTLAAGGAGWGVETMSIVQDSYDQKFKETGSVAKAEDAANKAFNGQVMLMPMYAVEMVPFFGNVGGKLAKLKMNNAATRFLTGGTIETVAELGQEYPQQLIEKAIADDKELSAALDYASVKGFESTVLNVAPTTILLGGAGAAVDTKTSKEDLAKSLAMRINIGELTDTAMEQKMLKMTVSEGQEFAKAFVAVQLREGNITEEQANKAASAIESGVATIEKAKEYKLNNENSYILATLDLKLKAAKAKAEAETDPMMKSIAEDRVKAIEKQANQVVKTGNAEVVLVEYPDGDFDILTYDEARTSMTNEEFMKSFVAGDIKFEAMGEGQKKLMSELQEKAKAMEPEAAPDKQKGRLTKFSTPQDGIVGEVTYEDGTKKELTQEEYDALEKQEGLFDVPAEETQAQKTEKAKERNSLIDKALAILEPIASAREELTVEQLAEVSEVLGEDLAGELISDQISKAPDAVDLYNLLDDNKVKIDDTQVTEQEGVGTEEQRREEDSGQVQDPEVSEEEGAADTVLQEEEELVSTTEEELDAIDKELSDQGVVEGALTGRSRKRKVVKAVRNGIKAISKVLPNVKIKLYETQDEYEQGTGRKGRGFYNFKEKSISINLESANARTVAHEIFHAFLFDKISTNEEAANISAKLFLELEKVEGKDSKILKELEEFASLYKEDGVGVMTEEKLAEYLGKVAENYDSLSARGKRAVREFVNSMLELIGKANPETKEFLPSRVSDNEVVDMLVGIGERVAAGEVIEAEDVKMMDPDYLGVDIGEGTRSRAGNRDQLEELFLSDKKPKLKSLVDVANFVKSWAKDNTLFDKDIKDIPDDQIVKEFADHISAELTAWDKVRKSEYVSFYDDDIRDRTNPTLQKYAMEEYGRPLTDSEVKLYHMVSAFASPNANPEMDSWKGFDIFDRFMKTGELSGYSDKTATEWEWTTSKTGKKVRKDTGIPRLDKEGKPMRSKVTPAYSQTGLDKFNLVLEKFNGDLDKTMDWLTSKHSYSDIAKMLDLPEKGSKANKENEYLSKEDGGIGIFGITGAKLGSYILNRFGNFSTVTKDMWYARTMARLAGEDLISVNKKTKKVGAIKTPWAESTREGKRKRKLADKAFKIVADQRGTSPAMIQEQIWDFEKRVYEKLGANEDASYTSDGLKRGIEEKAKSDKKLKKEESVRKGKSKKVVEKDIDFIEAKEGVLSDPPVGRDQKIKATIDFKNRYGKYFSISKIFNNEKHLENYINFMERKGNKEIGVERVSEIPDVSPTQPFAGREQKNAPLFSGKNKNIIDLANKYIAKKGLAAPEDTEIRRLNTEYSKAMADVYESAKHTPLDEDVQKAYKALAKESKEQFEVLKKGGYIVELWDGANEPYKNSTEMVEDLKDNKHLYVFSTEEGFGETGITPQDRRENPMLADSGYKDANGKKLLLNDLFRFVHDAFGHGKLGNSFGPVGEENAWYVHSQMFSPDARRAMTSETRGQNSWVNFGPQLRNKDGSLPKKGDKNYIPLSQRDFAPQKNFLFPDEYVFDRPNTQGRFEGRDQKVKVDKSTIKKNVVAAVDFIKKAALKIEDGVTLNIDGTRYDGGGLVVPISSMNVEQGTLKPSTVADFVEMNKGKLSNDTFKLGLYKFPKESTVSIDLSVIVPNENRKLALSVGKKLNQESLFDLDTGENIKTGGTGQNTVELTDEQAAELATSLVENKEPEFLGREQKTKEKKRGFLDRNIEKLKFASNLSEAVFENPEAFYEPQVLAEIKENAKYMSDSELIEAMSLDGLNSIMNISGSTNTNMAVLAAAELINRKLAANQDVESVVLQLNKMGTAVGQLMRQFGELKKSTPAGYMLTVERLAEKNNINLKEADRSKISQLVQAKTDLIKDLNEATENRIDPNLSLDEQKRLDKEIKKISNELYKVDSELNRFVQTKIPLKLTDTLIQIMQGNLLTTASLAVNILGNVSQLSLMFPVKFIASTFDSLRRFLIGGERTTSFSIPAYLYGAKSFVKTLPDAARILFWKGPRDDFNEMLKGEINNGLLGVRAWMVLMSKGGIPEPSKMSGFDKMLSMVSKEAGEKKLGAKANIALNLIIQGTFGVTADIMFRALQAGDIIFKRPYRDMSLYEIGKRKGLSGEKLKNTLKYPSKKELQMADEIAKEGTFQEDSALAMSSKLMTDAIVKAAEYLGSKIFAKNIAKLLARSQFPYVKTPANIASFTFKMNVPAIAFVASMNYLRKGDNRKAALNFGIGVTGSMISTVAIGLVANGLIQSMGDDDDPRERSLKYSTFPPGTINKSALMRVLNYIKEGYDKGGKSEMGERLRQFYVGEIPEEITVPRSGEDEFMSYLKLGIPGFVMGVYAMEDKDTAKKKAVNPAKENFIESMMGGTLKLPQSIKFISQQSFLQGTSALLNALTGSEYETDRWLTNTFRAVSSIPLPNQLASIARAQRDYLPDYRDEDLSVQFKNVMDDKIFFLRKETPSDQIRVDLWGRNIAQTPKGADPYMYHLGLDPLRNTTAREDNLSFEIYELYKRTGDARSIPSIVDDNFLHTYKGEKRRFNMTVAQTNRLQGIVGSIRQIKAQKLVESPRWQAMDDEQRIDKLSSIYRDAMKNTMVEKEKKIIAYNIALGLSEDKD